MQKISIIKIQSRAKFTAIRQSQSQLFGHIRLLRGVYHILSLMKFCLSILLCEVGDECVVTMAGGEGDEVFDVTPFGV